MVLSSVSDAQVADPDWTEAIQRTDEAFADLDSNVVPGCAVGVIHEGQYVLSKGYGMANLEHDIPIDASSVFRIGSLSKQFTAAAIALLAERGEIDLDADIHTYLPDLADYGVKVTTRQMIHHISGIPDYESGAAQYRREDGSLVRFGNEDFYTIEEFYDHAKNLQLRTNPEVEYSYSNTPYFFLSQPRSKWPVSRAPGGVGGSGGGLMKLVTGDVRASEIQNRDRPYSGRRRHPARSPCATCGSEPGILARLLYFRCARNYSRLQYSTIL